MTPEEYFRQRKQEGDREWARLLAMAEHGNDPSGFEIAEAIFQYGLEAASDAARYVAVRTANALPKKRGRPTTWRPDDVSQRWLYRQNLEDLQILRTSDPEKYAQHYGKAPPNKVAAKRVAESFDPPLNPRVIERLRKK